MIRSKIDRILKNLPEEELIRVYFYAEHLQKEYRFKSSLNDKGVVIETIFEESENIIALWDKTFAHDISEEVKEKIYYDQFKWHIFSNWKQLCSEKKAARTAFDAEVKDELYVMYQSSPYIFLYKNAKEVVAKDFDSQQDVYIFDKDFTWTYVHTHESMYGPYYYKVK
ncbi:DUF4275 family protein [Paenibacillus marinisediminis]